MPNSVVCAGCGKLASDADTIDEPFVCNACLGLPDRPTAPPKKTPPAKPDRPPPARRVVESAPSPQPPTIRGSWPAVASGYRYLWVTLVVLLLGTPLVAVVRFIEAAYRVPLLSSRISLGLLLLMLAGAGVMRLIGAVAVARKPRRGRVKGLARAVRGFAFVPVVNLLVFPLLLAVYTQAVGRETGLRSIRRAGWILLGCAIVLIPPIMWVLASVGIWAVALLTVFLDPMASNPRQHAPAPTPAPSYDPAASYLLFVLGAGCIIWLGAYIVTMITLSGVARALEQAPANLADSDSDSDQRNDEPA